LPTRSAVNEGGTLVNPNLSANAKASAATLRAGGAVSDDGDLSGGWNGTSESLME
jgi:hypothetical protein